MFNYGIQIEIGMIGLLTSVILRVIAAGYFIRVLQLARRDTVVRNGLKRLKKQLVMSVSITLFINTFGLILLIIRPLVSPYWFGVITDMLAIANSVGFLAIGIIKYKIWTQQYTPEQIELHRLIDKLEAGEAKLVMKGGVKK